MKKAFLLLFFLGLVTAQLVAQQADSLRTDSSRVDSLRVPAAAPAGAPVRDSVLQEKKDSLARVESVALKTPVDHSQGSYAKLLKSHPYLNFFGKGNFRTMSPRKQDSKDGLFYLLGSFMILLGFVKASFSRYFRNMFTVFFRASLKQKQIREQLLQTPLASLLLNIFFVAVGGLYAGFVIHQRAEGQQFNFWLLFLYSSGAIALLYLGKYFILKLLGWTLRISHTTDTYIFIVFLCNKVLAIFLLPLLLMAAFGEPAMVTVAMSVSYVLVAGVFLYRYISSYGYITRELRASRFHFFLYLCAFEVAPLLLIYKVLLKFV